VVRGVKTGKEEGVLDWALEIKALLLKMMGQPNIRDALGSL
jgi:hypothetical protein